MHTAAEDGGWTKYDNHWEGKKSVIKLSDWKKERRIVIVRKRRPENEILALEKQIEDRQQTLALIRHSAPVSGINFLVRSPKD